MNLAKGYQKFWAEQLEFNPDRHLKPCDPRFKDINPKGSYFGIIRPNPNWPCPTVTQLGAQRAAAGILHYNTNSLQADHYSHCCAPGTIRRSGS